MSNNTRAENSSRLNIFSSSDKKSRKKKDTEAQQTSETTEPQPSNGMHRNDEPQNASDSTGSDHLSDKYSSVPDLSPEEVMLEFRTSSSFTSLDNLVPSSPKSTPVLDGLVEAVLVWNGGGRDVSVAFSTDWNAMVKGKRVDGVTHFSVRLPPCKLTQFKFLVDGKWRVSADYATLRSELGQSNNAILPVLIEWPSPEKSVSVCFLHEKGQGYRGPKIEGEDGLGYSQCPRHGLKYANKKWTFSHVFSFLGNLRFMFIVNKHWMASSLYEITSHGDNVIRIPEAAATETDPILTTTTTTTTTQTAQTTTQQQTQTKPSSPAAATTTPTKIPTANKDTSKESESNSSSSSSASSIVPNNNAIASPGRRHAPVPVPAPTPIPSIELPPAATTSVPASHNISWDGLSEVNVCWAGAGESVELRTSQHDWTSPITLNKTSRGTWETSVKFEPFKPVQFKFVVDGVWRVSPDYDTTLHGYDENNIFVPIAFVWRGQASQVFVCGSFDGWKERNLARLVAPSTWVWSSHVTSTPAKIDFKFVVDGNWVTSSDYSKGFDENHNENNFVTIEIK